MKDFLLSISVILLWLTTAANIQAQAPTVNTYFPGQDANDVALDEVMQLAFDRDIVFNSSSTRYYVEIFKDGEVPPIAEFQIRYGIADSGLSITDSTLFIAPGTNLEPETVYYINISPDGIVSYNDSTGFAGITDETTWRFTTLSRPAISSKSPPSLATGVTGLQSLTLTYNEAITTASDKNLYIYKSGGTLFQTINTTNDTASISVDITNTTLTISHDAFNGAQDFYVDVENGFVTSQATGIGSAAIDGATEWSFTSADAPAIYSLSPAGAPSGVYGDKTLIITYNEDVTLINGKNITIHNGDGSVFQTISTDNTSLISFDSNTDAISINHDRFKGNTNYYVNMEEGVVTANDNNIASDAITGSGIWTFNTADAPILTFESPVDDAIDVNANEPLIIGFNEAVSLQSNKNVMIFNSDDTPFQTINTDANNGLFSFNGTNDTLTINHDAFAGSSDYYINIDETLVTSSTTAIGSEALTSTTAWSFTSASGPAISSFTPDGATDVTGDQILELNFTESVALADNKNISIYRTIDDQLFQTINTTSDAGLFTVVDTTLQISHDPLWGNSGFYILADAGLAVSSTTGIDAEGISATTRWTFTTIPGPTIDAYLPATAATGVSITTPFEIDFNENISLGTSGTVTIQLVSNDSVVETINFDSGQLSVSNDTLTISHYTLSPQTNYYINISNDLILSAVTGTPWAGINDQSWSFTTAAPPTISSYNPLNGETAAPVDQLLTLTFNENIKTGSSGYVKILEEGNLFFQDIPYNAGLLTINGTELQIAHDQLSPGTTYFITIDNNAIHSQAGDVPFAGISDTTQWRFTTANPPTADAFSPTNLSTLSSANQDLVVTFSEDVEPGATGSFRIRYTQSGGTQFQTITVEDTNYISITNNILTISPLEFTPDSGYYVLIDQGFIKSSTSGVSYPGIQDTTQWTFTAPAGAAINTYEPANNSIDIAIDSILTLTFDENISRGTGSMTIHYQSDGTDAVTINASSTSNVIISSDTLSFLNLNLPHEETLYVTMDVGFVESATSGFAFNGISDTTEWAFTTLPEPPAWISGHPYFFDISPSNIDLALMTSIVSDYYFVVTSNSAPPTITQIMNGQNSGGTIAPASGSGSLVASTQKIHTGIDISGLSEGYHWVHAVAKNPTKDLYSSIATIQVDKIAPVTTISPANGSTHFSETGNMIISFNEAIYTSGLIVDSTNVSGLVTLTLQGDGNSIDCNVSINTLATTITVNPDSDLSSQTSYTLTMAAVEDQVGNLQSSSSSNTFTTDKLNIWIGNGADPADWSDSANWSTGSFASNTSVSIPASATTFPVVSGNQDVYNVNLEPGAYLTHTTDTLTVNGEFRLQSSTAKNASYINTGGTVSVPADSVKIEQHVTDLTHIYSISSPVSGATKNNTGLDNLMYYYDNPTNTWVEMGNSEPMTEGTGYSSKSSQNLLFSGDINTDTMTLNLIRTTSGLGWNLMGNPYTASIDWTSTSLVKTNMVDAFWIYLDSQDAYGAYNDATGLSINITDPKIPSNHAFWVKVNEGQDNDTGSLFLSPDALTANTNSYLKSTSGSKYPAFKLAAISDGGVDETGVAFIPDASLAKDRYDTDKMSSNNADLLQIFTLSIENSKLCINGLPETSTDNLSLGYYAGKSGTYTLQMQADYLDANQMLVLTDHFTGKDNNLSQDNYSFEVTTKGTNTERFTLKVVQAVPTSIKKPTQNQNPECNVYTGFKQIIVETPNKKGLRYSLTNISGRTINNGVLEPLSSNYIDAPKAGIYILSIISKDGKEEHKVAVK
jgi:methionine-rich copper-binding protein CopC